MQKLCVRIASVLVQKLIAQMAKYLNSVLQIKILNVGYCDVDKRHLKFCCQFILLPREKLSVWFTGARI